MKICGVNVTTKNFGDDLKAGELMNYVNLVKSRVKEPVTDLEVVFCGDDMVDLNYRTFQKFERIRRITGYLVGTTDRWNDSKKAEEKDRVKHSR